MKRSSDSLEARNTDPKRQKIVPSGDKLLRIKHRQPGALELVENSQDDSIFDRELSRAICVGLHCAGFNAVRNRALESFRGAVEEFLQHFSARVNASMKHCRRAQPLPQDFTHALAQFGISSSDLLPDLDLQVPAKVTQQAMLPAARDFVPQSFIPAIFAEEARPDRTLRPYIPQFLPNFPSQHAYQETPVFIARETDALKVRERATQEGQQAEQTLRKLMAANKGGDRLRRMRGGLKPPEVEKRSEELYQAALAAMRQRDKEGRGMGSDGVKETVQADEVTTIANYDSLYFRRGKR